MKTNSNRFDDFDKMLEPRGKTGHFNSFLSTPAIVKAASGPLVDFSTFFVHCLSPQSMARPAVDQITGAQYFVYLIIYLLIIRIRKPITQN